MIKKSLMIALIGMLVSPLAVYAETVMEKITRTGTLTIGTRTDAIPYSYVNDRNELVGYSMDAIEQIRSEIEARLGKPVELEVVELQDFASAIGGVKAGDLDLVCTTSFTWERDRFVDFSISYGITGIGLLAPTDSNLGTAESLAGKRIGVQKYTIAESTLKLIQPQAILVPIDSVQAGIQTLTSKKVDALAGDRIALAGIEKTLPPNTYKISPEKSYADFGLACMLPPNNSSFADVLNYSLAKMMQSYMVGDPATVKLIDRWFGKAGVVPVDSELIKKFFEWAILMREQVPTSSPTISTPSR